MQVISGRERVDVAAWPREGANVETPSAPSFSFTDDEAGRNARTEAVRLWARGETAKRNSQDLWIGVSRDLLITTL